MGNCVIMKICMVTEKRSEKRKKTQAQKITTVGQAETCAPINKNERIRTKKETQMTNALTELQQTAVVCGLNEDPTLLSEFELHKFIREATIKANEQNNNIHIWNVFRVFGMPDTAEEQEATANKMFKVDTYHVHSEDDDEYFIVRHTKVDGDCGIGVHKLDPNIQSNREQMHNLVSMIIEGFNTNAEEE